VTKGIFDSIRYTDMETLQPMAIAQASGPLPAEAYDAIWAFGGPRASAEIS
jgi:hypothetical protein